MTTRRQFLVQGLTVAAATTIPARAKARLNLERLRVGLIGCGARGKYLIGNLPDTVHVVALCDCYLQRVEQTQRPESDFSDVLAKFAEGDGKTATVFQDYRRMIEKAKLDAVIIAAPDHHHVGMAWAACHVGLDIYVEKPLSLTIAEGRTLVAAERRSGRIVQVGSQQRSMAINREGCEFVRAGRLGRVSLVELPNYPGPMASPEYKPEEPPAGFDWNLFCGSVPLLAHNKMLWVKDEFRVGDKLWRGWDLWRQFSGHLMTNWGAHSVDMVQMALGMDDSGPIEIRPEPSLIDAKINLADKVERLRFCPVTMRYANGVELRFNTDGKEAIFHGERGRMYLSRNRVRTDPPELLQSQVDPDDAQQWIGKGNVARPHLENWIECIATRKTPRAPVEVGHRTATVCHLANIARELGRPLRWNPEEERFVDDSDADALLDRPRRLGFGLADL